MSLAIYTINSKDESDIIATNIMKAISTTTNDCGASLAAGLFNAVFDEYDYTSKSGTQTLSKNDKVRIASDHEAIFGPTSISQYKPRLMMTFWFPTIDNWIFHPHLTIMKKSWYSCLLQQPRWHCPLIYLEN